MTTKKLTRKQRILVATTLFGMFFGAGNLIFPVHLGQMAGSNVIGFIITAVGIPIFGVAAIGVTHSDGLQTLSGKVGKGYGIFFTCLLYLTIGPLFAIPRCATVSFTTGVSPMLPEAAQPLALLLFSAVFFAFVLFFSLRPGKITVWIGKIINPVFLLFLAVRVPLGCGPDRALRHQNKRVLLLVHRGLRHHGRHRGSCLRHCGHRCHPPHGR